MLGKKGRNGIFIAFLVEAWELDCAVCIQDVHQGGVGEPLPCSLVNSKSGPTLADRKNNFTMFL